MKEDLNVLVQAQYPLIYLVTFEEERAEQTVAAIARRVSKDQDVKPAMRVFTWTMTRGSGWSMLTRERYPKQQHCFPRSRR